MSIQDSGAGSADGSARLHRLMVPRLGRLSTGCRRMLVVAAVLGREFDLEVLRRTAGVAASRMPLLLEEAAAEGLIDGLRESPGRARFAHDLIREALGSMLTTSRRGRLHRRAAEALRAVHGRSPLHLAELALHYAAAVPPEPGRAAEYAILAGERAMATLAYEEAERLFRLGLEILERLGPNEGFASLRERLRRSLARAAALTIVNPVVTPSSPRDPHEEGESEGSHDGSEA